MVVASAPKAMWSESLTHLVATAHSASMIKTPRASNQEGAGPNDESNHQQCRKGDEAGGEENGSLRAMGSVYVGPGTLADLAAHQDCQGQERDQPPTRSRLLSASRGPARRSAAPTTSTAVTANGWTMIEIHRASVFIPLFRAGHHLGIDGHEKRHRHEQGIDSAAARIGTSFTVASPIIAAIATSEISSVSAASNTRSLSSCKSVP